MADTPNIRFSGFTDAWEQRKLGTLVEKYEDPIETPHDGYERLGIRSHAKGTFHSYVEPGKELETAKMHRVAANNFIVNITFGWEHAVAITDETDAGKLVSHRFPQFSFAPELIPQFFKYVMVDKKFKEHLELSSPGGAGRNRVLKINEMLEYNVKYPSIIEQTQIMKYFTNLDNLITFHQRKYLFAVDYFKAWEQRKLEDEAIEIVAGGDIDKNKIVDLGIYPVIANALTNDGIVGYYNDEFRIKAPAVTVTGRGDVGHAKARNIDFTPVVRLLSVRTNHDVDFLEHAINNHNVIIESTGVPQLTVPQLSNYQIFFPKTYDEEKYIGVFFKSLDDLITFHRRAHK